MSELRGTSCVPSEVAVDPVAMDDIAVGCGSLPGAMSSALEPEACSSVMNDDDERAGEPDGLVPADPPSCCAEVPLISVNADETSDSNVGLAVCVGDESSSA